MNQPFEDDRLSLIFTCCHPAINMEAQIGLTLRTLGGLTTTEIARAFLVPEPTLAQRLVRAQRKIQQARIPYQVPAPGSLPERLSAVQAVLYLIFNEGYSASSATVWYAGNSVPKPFAWRAPCSSDAPQPGKHGAAGAHVLHDSRRDARSTRDGNWSLEEQDRSLWHQDQIAEGIRLVERALGRRNSVRISYRRRSLLSTQKPDCAETDWKQIAALYAILSATTSHPSSRSTTRSPSL